MDEEGNTREGVCDDGAVLLVLTLGAADNVLEATDGTANDRLLV